MYDILELKKKKLQDLQDIAEKLKISDLKNYKKLDLIYEILDNQAIIPTNSKPEKRKIKTPISRKKIDNSKKSENKNILKILHIVGFGIYLNLYFSTPTFRKIFKIFLFSDFFRFLKTTKKFTTKKHQEI
jgi:transcription termination factor Rho